MKKYSVYNPSSYSRSKMFATLDLGTTACRLLISEKGRHHSKIRDIFSRITRLGEGIKENGALSDEAMDRTLDALKECADRLQNYTLFKSRFFATEACRIAENQSEFLQRVKDETGLDLEIISPDEESRLCMWACADLLTDKRTKTLIIDTGGGSTDFSLIDSSGEEPHITDSLSVPYGVISLSEIDPVNAKEKIRSLFEPDLIKFGEKNHLSELAENHLLQTIGMSGTVTTLAAFFLKLKYYSHFKVDGLPIKRADLLRISRELQQMTKAEKEAHACIGEERAALTSAGCLIIETILDLFPIESITACDRGLREGAMIDLMRQEK